MHLPMFGVHLHLRIPLKLASTFRTPRATSLINIRKYSISRIHTQFPLQRLVNYRQAFLDSTQSLWSSLSVSQLTKTSRLLVIKLRVRRYHPIVVATICRVTNRCCRVGSSHGRRCSLWGVRVLWAGASINSRVSWDPSWVLGV